MKLKDIQNQVGCPRCAKGNLLTDSNVGERFCDMCGYVVDERLEGAGPEWRVFSNEDYEKKSRTGIPSSLAIHDRGLATVIDPLNRDAYGRPIASSMKGIIERLRIWDGRSRVRTPIDRNLVRAFGEINTLKYKLGLSDAVIEKTAYTYRKAIEGGLMQGRSISGIAAAALYIACREMDAPRSLDEIADAIDIKKKVVARCYRMLLRDLDIKMPVVDPITCVGRIASKCNLGEKIKRTAVQILKDAKMNDLTAGKNPAGLAATALYLSSVINGENKSQKEIAFAAGITEVTIRNRYRSLRKDLNL